MIDETRYEPGAIWFKKNRSRIDHLKERFASLAAYIHARRGWVTSVPGAYTMTFQCLPQSELPDKLLGMGYRDIAKDRLAERILSHAISETVPIEGSTRAEIRHHAGLVSVEVWTFTI